MERNKDEMSVAEMTYKYKNETHSLLLYLAARLRIKSL